MKKLYIYFFVLSMLSVGACNKALDMAPDGKISLGDVFTDTTKLRGLLNTCYDNVPTKGTRYYFWSRGPVVWSDEAWDTDAESEPTLSSGRLYSGSVSAENFTPLNSFDARNGDYWAKYWTSIRNCALIINGIDTASAQLHPDVKSRYKAEAYLLRAYFYSELLKWFGPVLPISRSPYNFTEDFSKLKKESYYNVVKFIIEDCDAALALNLPERIMDRNEPYRMTKAVAEAIKSKMILFAASPLNNDGGNYWEEAYQVNKTSLANLRKMGYELYRQVNFPSTYKSEDAHFGPDNNEYAALYNEYFTNKVSYSESVPLDRETIWESRDNQGNVWNIDGIGAQDGYKSGTCPSQELVDAYETIDGQPILDLANPYLDEKHTQPNYNKANTLYNPDDPYKNRDPRFYASIYYNGSKRTAWWGFNEVAESVENYPAGIGYRTRVVATWAGEPQTGISGTVRKATRTGYFERKFQHPNAGSGNVIVAGANTKLFRLGEVILNFAEAAAEAGHLDEAAAAVNEIRRRVNMPDIPTGLTKEQMILRVRHERRVELAMEENRYFDVRRWTAPNGDLSKTDKYVTAMEITRRPDGTFSYKRRPVRESERLCYTNKFLRWPVPLAEANRLKAITGQDWQNPGW